MGEDRALDEFIGEDEEADDSGATDPERDEPPTDGGSESAGDDVDAESDADDEGGAVSTTAFAPEGAACESCGASVRRRWRDDGALVCADCKAW